MGVGIELLGKHVRCPHCKQVVLAPATAGTSASWPSAPLPPPPAAPKPPEPPAPVFNVSQRESADSILGDPDESEDDVFGSHGSNRHPVPQMPDAPEPPPPAPTPATPAKPAARPTPAAPPPASGSPFAFEGELPIGEQPTKPLSPTRPAAEPVSTMVLPTPFPTADANHPPPAPPPAAPARPAPAAPAPAPPAGAGPSNPWAGLNAMAAPAAPAPAPVVVAAPAVVPQPVAAPRAPDPKESREEEPPRTAARATRGRPPVAAGVPKSVVYALGAYALLMTGLAVYGLFFKSASLPPEHPLSTIPDNFGEFPPADRKKASAARFPLDGELPANQKARLGGKIEIGQLEIVPVQIEKRKMTLVREGEKRPVEVPAGEGLVLRLRVKNTSPDAAIFPLDPAFQRKEGTGDTPATRIVVGRETFAGGPITWPFGKNMTREYEKEQEAEARPLPPGESRDYFVCSASDRRIFDAVKNSNEPALWRVQVRRGLIEFRGKDVPVTAIIGVEFRRSEVPGL
jgi:hypothetical protein